MKNNFYQSSKPLFPTVLSLVCGFGFLEILALLINESYFPKISGVFWRLFTLLLEGEVLVNLWRSLQNLFLGFLISVAFGLAIGLLCGRDRSIEKIFRPYINALLTSPTVVFAPIYFAIFGLSRWAIVSLIVHYSIFFIIVNTTTAVQSADRAIIEMAMVFGATERQQMRLVFLPSALPFVFAALRVALARSVKGMINGELLIAVVGLGAFSQNFASLFDAEGVFAIAVLVVLVALTLTWILNALDKRINHWVPDIRKT